MDIILGAIAGDIIGSCYEFKWNIPKDFTLFNETSKYTDDTVLTIAILDSLLNNDSENSEQYLKRYAKNYPNSGFGPGFINWVLQPSGVQNNSFGNGAAMRVSAVGALAKNEETLLKWIQEVTVPSHNHIEAIKGATAIAMVIYKAKNGHSKKDIHKYVTKDLGYDLNIDFEKFRDRQIPEFICQTTVPFAIACFLESNDYESCIRLAVSLGGDTDTVACMAGGIAAAFYGGIPLFIKQEVIQRLPDAFKVILGQSILTS